MIVQEFVKDIDDMFLASAYGAYDSTYVLDTNTMKLLPDDCRVDIDIRKVLEEKFGDINIIQGNKSIKLERGTDSLVIMSKGNGIYANDNPIVVFKNRCKLPLKVLGITENSVILDCSMSSEYNGMIDIPVYIGLVFSRGTLAIEKVACTNPDINIPKFERYKADVWLSGDYYVQGTDFEIPFDPVTLTEAQDNAKRIVLADKAPMLSFDDGKLIYKRNDRFNMSLNGKFLGIYKGDLYYSKTKLVKDVKYVRFYGVSDEYDYYGIRISFNAVCGVLLIDKETLELKYFRLSENIVTEVPSMVNMSRLILPSLDNFSDDEIPFT